MSAFNHQDTATFPAFTPLRVVRVCVCAYVCLCLPMPVCLSACVQCMWERACDGDAVDDDDEEEEDWDGVGVIAVDARWKTIHDTWNVI